jgi:hypothetical protein
MRRQAQMEGQIDSHHWSSKIQTHQLISGRPDLEIEAETLTAGEDLVETHPPAEPRTKKHDAERSSVKMPYERGFLWKICIYLNRHAEI